MRAVVTVIGRDREGIIARVSEVLWKRNINILDIAQNVLSDVFAMIMLVNLEKSTADITDIKHALDALGEEIGVKIVVMHEDIFNSMHRI